MSGSDISQLLVELARLSAKVDATDHQLDEQAIKIDRMAADVSDIKARQSMLDQSVAPLFEALRQDVRELRGVLEQGSAERCMRVIRQLSGDGQIKWVVLLVGLVVAGLFASYGVTVTWGDLVVGAIEEAAP